MCVCFEKAKSSGFLWLVFVNLARFLEFLYGVTYVPVPATYVWWHLHWTRDSYNQCKRRSRSLRPHWKQPAFVIWGPRLQDSRFSILGCSAAPRTKGCSCVFPIWDRIWLLLIKLLALQVKLAALIVLFLCTGQMLFWCHLWNILDSIRSLEVKKSFQISISLVANESMVWFEARCPCLKTKRNYLQTSFFKEKSVAWSRTLLGRHEWDVSLGRSTAGLQIYYKEAEILHDDAFIQEKLRMLLCNFLISQREVLFLNGWIR